MSNLIKITSKFYDRSGARVINLNVKSRYKGSSRENLNKTDFNGLFVFYASPNRTIEILAKPPNVSDYMVFKVINSSIESTVAKPIEVKLPKTIDEYRKKNKSSNNGLVTTVFKVIDNQGKVMTNFPMKTRPKGKNSFERTTDEKGIIEVQSSPNRDIEILALTSKDEFVLKIAINSGNGTQQPILIKLDEPYENFLSILQINILDRDGSDYIVEKTNVELVYLETGKKNIYSTSNGKITVTSMIGQKVQLTVLKPNGKPLDPVIYIGTRIKAGPIKLHLDVNIESSSTKKNDPNIEIAVDSNSCGLEFRGKVRCTRYNKVFGPLYSGTKSFSSYDKWDELIANGRLNNDDKIVLMGVAPNEGNFDAVQSYDSEIITAGAMQKTVNSSGTGELPEQLYKFKQQYPILFKSLFESCGWVVIKSGNSAAKAVYNGLSNSELKKMMRENCNKDVFGKNINCAPIESMIAGVSHPLFIDLQVVDFIDRLRDFMSKTPIKYRTRKKMEKNILYNYKIEDYVKSNLGKATVLDHSINRPGHVTRYFGEALNYFFHNNKNVSENPNEWGESRAEYELKILDFYGANRGNMTHSNQRYNKTKKLISELEK